MEAFTALSLASIGQAGRRLECADDSTVVYATGSGLVLQNVETGSQVITPTQLAIPHSKSHKGTHAHHTRMHAQSIDKTSLGRGLGMCTIPSDLIENKANAVHQSISVVDLLHPAM